MEEVSIVGVDLAKQVFQLHGAAADGRFLFRKWVSLLHQHALPNLRDHEMKKLKVEHALSFDCDENMLKSRGDIGLAIFFERIEEARKAKKVTFDSNAMTSWRDLVEAMSSKLGFQEVSNRGYDFVLDGFVDCMRDVVDNSEQGLILIFIDSNKLLMKEKRYTFERWFPAMQAVVKYAGQTIEDGEWWDRGPRYLKVVFQNADKTIPGTEIEK